MYVKGYNKTSKNLPLLEPKDNVTVYDHVSKTWESGKVLEKHETPRSYIVQDHTGNVVRRNRVGLRSSLNDYVPNNDFEDSESECQNNANNTETHSAQNESPEAVNVNVNIPPVTDKKCVSRSGRPIKKPNRLDL